MSAAKESSPAVWARLPRAGLGNMLYVWARALAFAHMNDAELFVSSWSRFRVGPYFRRERSKRLYLGSFRTESLSARLRLLALRAARMSVYDPPLTRIVPGTPGSSLYIFSRAGGDPTDPFRELIPYRAVILTEFFALLSERIRARVDALEPPVVGIHVRRGDFRDSAWETPMEHFLDRLRAIRAIAGRDLPATVFSDGTDKELSPLLAMTNVRRAPRQSEILDLIQLSRSRVLVPSRGSTFSMIAGFFSEAVILRDPVWNHGDSRPAEINSRRFEGGPEMNPAMWPKLLVQNLLELH